MNILLGLLFIAAGVAGSVAEYRHPPVHPWVLLGYGVAALLGALIIRPDPIFDRLKRAGDFAGPYLPTFGRRVNSGEVSALPPKDEP